MRRKRYKRDVEQGAVCSAGRSNSQTDNTPEAEGRGGHNRCGLRVILGTSTWLIGDAEGHALGAGDALLIGPETHYR